MDIAIWGKYSFSLVMGRILPEIKKTNRSKIERTFYFDRLLKLREPDCRPGSLLQRRRREITLRLQLYHAPPKIAGRLPYASQTIAQRNSLAFIKEKNVRFTCH